LIFFVAPFAFICLLPLLAAIFATIFSRQDSSNSSSGSGWPNSGGSIDGGMPG
jgi:hypothetical protein